MTTQAASGPLQHVRTADTQHARADGGPAHGHCWEVDSTAPPSVLCVQVGADTVFYRLVWHPGAHRPARDHSGAYLYLPVRQYLDRGESTESRSETGPLPDAGGTRLADW